MNKYLLRPSRHRILLFAAVYFVTVITVWLSFQNFLFQWNYTYEAFMRNHLNESMRRISDEIRQKGFTPSPGPSDLSQLLDYINGEGVFFRWTAPDEKTVVADTFNGKTVQDAVSMQIWGSGKELGSIRIAWKPLSANGYPFYSLDRDIKRMAGWSEIGSALFALIVSAVIASLLSKPIETLSSKVKTLFNTRKLPTVDEEGPFETRQIAKALNFLSFQLEEHENWRQALMQDLAHELRTPLSILVSQLVAFADGVFQADPMRIRMMLDDVNRLTRLVNDMERLLQANSAVFELKLEEIDLVPLVKQVIDIMQSYAQEKEIVISLTTPKKPCPVRIDVDKMIQVFMNLITNAIKYTEYNGKIEIAIAPLWMDMTIEVEIKDDGIGISEKDLPFIFDRFYREDKSRSRATGGSGLGLTIAKKLVEAHEGKITVESVVGAGCVFTVILPLCSDTTAVQDSH